MFNVISSEFHEKKYLSTLSRGREKIFIVNNQLGIENKEGKLRVLRRDELAGGKEIIDRLSEKKHDQFIQDHCYANVLQRGQDDYAVRINARILGGGLCMSLQIHPFILAANSGDITAVQDYISSGLSVDNYTGPGKITALMAASNQGHTAVVEALIHAGADVNRIDSCGKTALFFACWRGHSEIVNILLSSNARINSKITNPTSGLTLGQNELMVAASYPDLAISTAIVKQLLLKNADVDYRISNSGFALLHNYVSIGHLEMTQLLISFRANVNIATLSNRRFQLNSNKFNGVVYFPAKTTPLMIAARLGLSDIIIALLSAGPELNLKNDAGETAIIIASKFGQVEAVKLLLSAGADPSIKDKQGYSARVHPVPENLTQYHNEIIALLNSPPPLINFVAGERPFDPIVMIEDSPIIQRIEENAQRFEGILRKMAKSIVRRIFDDNGDAERQALVESMIYDHFHSSEELMLSEIDLPDDPAHIKRRNSVVAAIVNALQEKKYLWNQSRFNPEEFAEELKEIILVWSSDLNSLIADRSRLQNIEDSLSKLTSNSAAMYNNHAQQKPESYQKDLAKTAGKEAAKVVGSETAKAVMGILL